MILDFLSKNKILLIIVIFSFFLSVGYSFYFRIIPVVDARAYDIIATNIVNGNGYREDMSKDISQDPAIIRVGPLYEYFLAGIYNVFGHSYGAVWAVQALLRALSTWLIYLTACLVLDGLAQRKKMALLAAGIFGFYPDLVEISAMLLTETLYLFFVCLTLYLFFRYAAGENKFIFVSLALVLGLAILARPPVIFFVPVVLFYFFKKREFKRLAVFLVILGAVFIPWTARNYIVYHEFMPLGAAGNFNFWIGNYHGGRGEQEPNQEQFDFALNHPLKEINSESVRQFGLFLVQHPGEFIKLTFLRVNKYFSLIRPIGFWFYQTGIGQALVVFSSALASVFLFILGFGGFWEAIKQKSTNLLYLVAFTITTPLIIFITVVETRYRFQIYPLLAIFAGFFAIKLWTEKKWWANKILWTAAIILSSNALVDLFLSLDRLREKFSQFLK